MKFFASILSLYILVLTATPCFDELKNDIPQNSNISQTSTSHNDQSDIDFCSPFCVCSCCVSSISNQEVFHVDFTCNSFSLVQYSKYTSGFSSFNFASIWQPPKLV